MLEYNRIDISECIDINKCEETSTKCSLCKFYYFLDKNFVFMSKKDTYILIKNVTIIEKKGTL